MSSFIIIFRNLGSEAGSSIDLKPIYEITITAFGELTFKEKFPSISEITPFVVPFSSILAPITGSIKDDILNIEELALGLIGYLQEFYPAALKERYSVEEGQKPLDILTAVAKARGCLKKGEELDYEKASRLLLEEFRSGKLGKVTLEFPKGTEEA